MGGVKSANIPGVPTQPNSRVRTLTEFSNNFEARSEILASSYGIELVMPVPRVALFFDKVTDIRFRAQEARLSVCVGD